MQDTFHRTLARYAHQTPDAPALLAPNEPVITFSSCFRAVIRLHDQLLGLGLAQSDRVAMVMPNGPEGVLCQLGVSSACACLPLNPALSGGELELYLSEGRAKAVLFDESNEALRDVARRLNLQAVLVNPKALCGTGGELPGMDGIDWSDWPQPDDIALILHTSGTTARPKWVPILQRALHQVIFVIGGLVGQEDSDRAIVVMPTFHLSGIGTVFVPLAYGSSVICPRQFELSSFFESLARERPTFFDAGPSLLQMILTYGKSLPQPIEHSLRYIRVGTAASEPALLDEVESFFGVPVVVAYGSTEATTVTTRLPDAPRSKRESVGKAVGCEVRIIAVDSPVVLDEDGAPKSLEAGGTGEVVVRGGNVMKGYLDNADANRESFIGEWYRTGDLGRLDEDGYLYYEGRVREMINRAGLKVAPQSVEEVIMRHCGVEEVVAFPIRHPVLGEDLGLAVVRAPGSKVSAEDIKRHAAEHLSYYKVPARVVFVDELPRGATGKVARNGLAEKLGVLWDDVVAL